jgi:AcrR family transcriptional regulator
MKSAKRLSPRKMPVQARSLNTVEAIFEACIQVLTTMGVERLTTTRVAERAGVSVGTLYQYFPNKQALLAAVLEKHLLLVVSAVEEACNASRGKTSDQMASALVEAFMDAKFADPDASRALYAVAPTVDGEAMVVHLTQKAQRAMCEMLVTASDRAFDQPPLISFVLSTALVGPVQILLSVRAEGSVIAATRRHLVSMAQGYLDTVGVAR